MPETLDTVQRIPAASCPAHHFSLLSQEEFKKNNEEKLTRVLCQEEQAEVCSLLLAQSEVRPQCLLLVLTNGTGKGQGCAEV